MADTNNQKIVTDEILKKALSVLAQDISNHLYIFEEYSSDEVTQMLDLDESQAIELQKVITESVVAKNMVYSSNRVEELLTELELDVNKYAENLVANISSVNLVWCPSGLPTEGEANNIYVVQKTVDSNTVNTLNLWDKANSTYVEIGNLDFDFTTIYTKDEIDNKLLDYAKKNETVANDKVVQNMDTPTSDTILSTTALQLELAKKIDKTSIATSVDKTTPSDEKVVSESAVVNAIPTDEYITNIALKKALVGENTIWDENCKYGTDIIRFPLGIHRFGDQAVTHYPELPVQRTGVLYIKGMAPVDSDFTTTPWQIRRYVYEDYTGDVYIRTIQTGSTANVITNDTGWVKSLDTADITTSITSSSTDDKVPSAKAVETRVNKVSKCTVYSNEDLNLITEPGLYACVGGDTYGATHNFPVADNGYLQHIVYPADNYCMQTFVPNGVWGGQLNMYIRRQVGAIWSPWQRLCGTTIADVSKTSISWSDETYFKSDDIISTGNYYQVRNGVCFVNIDIMCTTPMTGGYVLPIVLPKPTTDYVHVNITSLPNGAYEHSSITLAISTSGTNIVIYGGIANDRYLGQFSYPVAES